MRKKEEQLYKKQKKEQLETHKKEIEHRLFLLQKQRL